MKKSIILILLLGAGFPLFARTNSRVSVFIPPVTGIGKDESDNTAIAKMLTNEIKARNFTIAKSIQEADLILYGTLAPYHEEEQFYHDYVYLNTSDSSAPVTTYTYNSLLQNSPEQVYIFQLILKNEKTNEAMLLQNLLYHTIDDVYNFFPLLIYNLFYEMTGMGYIETFADSWRDKWLYLRASFDFPITFYTLKGDGLIDGIGVYEGDFEKPSRVSPLDNKVVALPGITAGVEVQFFKWLSVEPNFQVNWEHLNGEDFLDMAAGLQLKFPLKFIRNVMLEPYGAVVYPFSTSLKVFNLFPLFAFGGGLQVGIKGGGLGVFFVDINYMYCYGDTRIINPYGELYPNPEVIHYKRSVIGLGVGYKFGLFKRK